MLSILEYLDSVEDSPGGSGLQAHCEADTVGHALSLLLTLLRFDPSCRRLVRGQSSSRGRRVQAWEAGAPLVLDGADGLAELDGAKTMVQAMLRVLRKHYKSKHCSQVLRALALMLGHAPFDGLGVEEFSPLVQSGILEVVLRGGAEAAVKMEGARLLFHLVQRPQLLTLLLPSTREGASMAPMEALLAYLDKCDDLSSIELSRTVLRVFSRAVATCSSSGLALVDFLGGKDDGSLGLAHSLVIFLDKLTSGISSGSHFTGQRVTGAAAGRRAALSEGLHLLASLIGHPRCRALVLADITSSNSKTRMAVWMLENLLTGPLQLGGGADMRSTPRPSLAPGWASGAEGEGATVEAVTAKALAVQAALSEHLSSSVADSQG